jgi:hypothetical protein
MQAARHNSHVAGAKTCFSALQTRMTAYNT